MVSAPSPVTSGQQGSANDLLMQAMMSKLAPEQQQAIQQQLAIQAAKIANKKYISNSIRKFSPALVNGVPTQPYNVGSQQTFTLTSMNNGYACGIIVRCVVNYTLASGTSATYNVNAVGGLGFIDTVVVSYNKTQIRVRPHHLRSMALLGVLETDTLPNGVLAGQSVNNLQSYLVNPSTPSTTTGAQQTYAVEFFLPFNIFAPDETRGLLPAMPSQTGIQVTINTPQSLLGNHPLFNVFSANAGTGQAISNISGTISVEGVYFDGENYKSYQALSYDMSVLEGTIQMLLDQQLTGIQQSPAMIQGKLNIQGYHFYTFLYVIDGVSPLKFSSQSNMTYLSMIKDAVGANAFWEFGSQTNMDVREYFAEVRRLTRYHQDLDEGVVPLVMAGLCKRDGSRNGDAYLDNTKNGWPGVGYQMQLTTVSSANITPMIEPVTFFVNPIGLQAV